MDEDQYPKIVSFVVRFVQEKPIPGEQPVYRGVIRHIQTDRELAFTDWETAQGFMEKFVTFRDPAIND
jgi:hypothetical protein